jgi:hypothetical protein
MRTMTTNFQQSNKEAKLQKTIYSFIKTMAILFVIQMFVNIGFWSWGKWIVMGYVISIISQGFKGAWSNDDNDESNHKKQWNKRRTQVEDATIVIESEKRNDLDLDSRLGKSERATPVYRDSDFV